MVHPEVSAQWTQDGQGDVLISLKVPQDTVDTELFIKMTKGHFGILMDPWSSSSWRKYWSQRHTPNRITKEKIWCLKQTKAKQRISLHRTAGQDLMKQSTWKTTLPQCNPKAEGLLEQDDPQLRGAGKMQRKLNKVRFESRPRKRQRPMTKGDEDPIIVAYTNEEEEIALIIVAGLEGDDEQEDQEEEHTREEDPLQSPPEEEKGSLPYTYTPKSPPYPPPEDEDWETESMPELVDIDEDQDIVIVVPADQNADKDFFKDSERQATVKQKYDSEIKQAPWTPQTDPDNPLTKIGDMIPKGTPVYEGFWKNSDLDILSRLDAASEELKAKRKTQKETPEESSPSGQNGIDEIDEEDPHLDRPESLSLQTST